jgi:hypothetical protein
MSTLSLNAYADALAARGCLALFDKYAIKLDTATSDSDVSFSESCFTFYF